MSGFGIKVDVDIWDGATVAVKPVNQTEFLEVSGGPGDGLVLRPVLQIWFCPQDERRVEACDLLIEALQTIRSRALARLATAEAHASFHINPGEPETVQRAMAGDR